MIDIEKWLDVHKNRVMVVNAFPFVAMGLFFYFLMGLATSFLFVTGFVLILASIGGIIFGLFKVHEKLDAWSDGGE